MIENCTYCYNGPKLDSVSSTLPEDNAADLVARLTEQAQANAVQTLRLCLAATAHELLSQMTVKVLMGQATELDRAMGVMALGILEHLDATSWEID